MVKQIDNYSFISSFEAMGRRDQFSLEALNALYDYFTQLEEDLGEQIELDVIGICCDFTEGTLEDFKDIYLIPEDEDALEYLRERTEVIVTPSGDLVIANF
jgi:hypothetical protein